MESKDPVPSTNEFDAKLAPVRDAFAMRKPVPILFPDEQMILTVDLETTGENPLWRTPSQPGARIISLGYTLSTRAHDGQVVTILQKEKIMDGIVWPWADHERTRLELIKTEQHGFEPRCVEEFWSKQSIEEIRRLDDASKKVPAKPPMPAEQRIQGNIELYKKSLYDALTEYIEVINSCKIEPTIVSDNPGFDHTWIQLMTWMGELNRFPDNYCRGTEYSTRHGYITVRDVNSMGKMMSKECRAYLFARLITETKHTHRADEDAANMAHKYFVLSEYREAAQEFEFQIVQKVLDNRKRKLGADKETNGVDTEEHSTAPKPRFDSV